MRLVLCDADVQTQSMCLLGSDFIYYLSYFSASNGIFEPVSGSFFAALGPSGHVVPGTWTENGAEEVLAS